MKRLLFLLLVGFAPSVFAAGKPVALFYMTSNPKSIRDFFAHSLWVFYTDLRTFKERYQLMQQNGLEGFCSWVLGEEDPAIWGYLPPRS